MRVPAWLKGRRPPLDLDEEDFQEEIRAHLAIAAEERIAGGEDPREAHYAALREFGNVTRATEAARSVWTPRWLESLRDSVRDVRHAIRALARAPGFSLTVIGVLTLGIGLNAAVFTMLKGFAFSPLAGVDGSARLAVIFGETNAGRPVRLSYPAYQHLRDHEAFSGLFGTAVAKLNLGRGRRARHIRGEFVTGNYFEILGVRAQRGRVLQPSDEMTSGRHPTIVLSDGLWRREFAADPDIVGQQVEINNRSLTVVGVADRKFHGTTVVYDVEAFIPVTIAPQLGFTFGSQQTTPTDILADPRAGLFFPQGYLRPGMTLARAASQVEAMRAPLSRERPASEAFERLRVVPFWQTPKGAASFILPTLGVLTAMGLLVLLIACANVAGLVLVRGISRRGEIAVRLALGASGGRIVRLLLVENLVLAVPGAVLGVLLAREAIPVLVSYAEWLSGPERIFFNVGVDGFVIAFAALVACGSALAVGFVPALQSSRVELARMINEDASPRGAVRGRLRAALVVAEVAVSLLLLVGAGLATRSVEAAREADPGFDAAHLTAVRLDVRQNAYDEARGRIFYRKLLDAVRADPAIESATLAMHIPLGMLDTREEPVIIDGYAWRRGEDLAFMSNVVGPDYFHTLRIPIVAGRAFEDGDREAAAPVAVVNRTLAQRFWGDAENALGKRLRIGTDRWRTVVGVAADLKYSRIDEAPRPYVYLPFLQSYRPGMVLHARGTAPPAEESDRDDRLIEHVRAHVAALDPEMPVLEARPMAEAIRGALVFLDLTAAMLFVFGAAGMALAALGTYGLVSYDVRRSTHEIGIRMALGASGVSVVSRFVGRGLRLGALGAALGVVGALGVGRLLDSILFGVAPTDGPSFARAVVLVFAIVVLATFLPAWRAARADTLSALRHH